MRGFCFTFIVYIVLLLTQPCQDLAAKFIDCQDSDTQAAHMERSSNTDPFTGDECSPFCVCSCCSHPVSSHKFPSGLTLRVESREIPTTIDNYVGPYDNAHQSSIWQPPKA